MTMTPQQREMFDVALKYGWDWFETPSGLWKFTREGFVVKVWFSARRTGKIITYVEHFSSTNRKTTNVRGGGAAVLRILRGGWTE